MSRRSVVGVLVGLGFVALGILRLTSAEPLLGAGFAAVGVLFVAYHARQLLRGRRSAPDLTPR